MQPRRSNVWRSSLICLTRLAQWPCEVTASVCVYECEWVWGWVWGDFRVIHSHLSLSYSVSLSLSHFIALSLYRSITLSLYFSVSLSLCLSISLSLYLSFTLSLSFSVSLFLCLSLSLSLCLYITQKTAVLDLDKKSPHFILPGYLWEYNFYVNNICKLIGIRNSRIENVSSYIQMYIQILALHLFFLLNNICLLIGIRSSRIESVSSYI